MKNKNFQKYAQLSLINAKIVFYDKLIIFMKVENHYEITLKLIAFV